MTEHDSTTCSQCRLTHRKILHHIRLTGIFRRLCTTCVLRLHSKSFCPSCLTVYHRSPPDHAVLCYKCHSSSHRSCISPSVPVRTPCATCLNPNNIVFDPKSPDRINSYTNSSTNDDWRIDIGAARLLVAAAEISAVSMSKAEAAAVTEAEWRAKEALEWRKKAKEAVNHVLKVMEVEKKESGDDCKGVVDDVGSNCYNSIGSVEVSEGVNEGESSGEHMCRMVGN